MSTMNDGGLNMNINKLLSIPKSLYFNLSAFPLKIAVKMSVLVSYKTKLKGIKKNKIIIDAPIKFGLIKIGFGGVDSIMENKHSFFRIDNGGKIIFKEKCLFSSGVSLRISPNSSLTLGNNFSANKNFTIFCDDINTIGNDVLVGWNVNIRSSDGHHIYDTVNKLNNPIVKPVTIGNHVWIASNVDILKGSYIPDNCVVAYRSCVLSRFTTPHCIIGGYPAKVLRENISWKY